MAIEARRSVDVPVVRVRAGLTNEQTTLDSLACEEPVEIRLGYRDGTKRSVAITMRTPGDDAELAVGFLLSEGIIRSREEVSRVTCQGISSSVHVELTDDVRVELGRLERHFYATSSCGVCG